MLDVTKARSFLCADVGSALTQVCVVEYVQDSYRFVAHAARSTSLDGRPDGIMEGIREAVGHLETITQRSLLADEGLIVPQRSDGSGVDALVVTISAAPPLDCAVMGMVPELSLQSVRRACQEAYGRVRLEATLAGSGGLWDGALLDALRHEPPEAIILAGGVDAGITAPLIEAGRLLSILYEDVERQDRPILIYAGNPDARRPLSDALAGRFDLRVVENVRPSLARVAPTELQRELHDLYLDKVRRLPGCDLLAEICAAPLQTTADGLETVLRFLAEYGGEERRVLGVDVGSLSTGAFMADGTGCRSVLLAGLGSGFGAAEALEGSSASELCRWLPIAVDPPEMAAYVQNACLHPRAVPQTERELQLTQGIVRRALRVASERLAEPLAAEGVPGAMDDIDLIAYRGMALAGDFDQGVALLTLLDGLPTAGLTQLVGDWAAIWPQLGALASIAPQAAAQTLASDGLATVGTLLTPGGRVPWGRPALSLRLIRPDGDAVEAEILAGSVRRFALEPDQQATLEVRPNADLDIGMGHLGAGGRAEVRGGSLGLIVDTRGRPLVWPAELSRHERVAHVQRWLEELCR